MSWSVQAVGTAKAVGEKLTKDFANNPCKEPEESIKNAAAVAINRALMAYPPDSAVTVTANGSQSVPDASKPDEAINNLSITISPLWGFVK